MKQKNDQHTKDQQNQEKKIQTTNTCMIINFKPTKKWQNKPTDSTRECNSDILKYSQHAIFLVMITKNLLTISA
jgi:hypothetical protein